MDTNYDHILIVGFGGPEKPEEVFPFLKIVTSGRNIPEERLKAVAHHYEAIGGFSPYNRLTFELVEKMKSNLKNSGIKLPVFVGMRNWNPFLKDTLREIRESGLKKGIGVILSALHSEASCKRYKENVHEANQESAKGMLQYDYLPPWHKNPHFISAQSDHVKQTLATVPKEENDKILVLFTAHSIPVSMEEHCEHCSYPEEFKQSSWLVASACGLQNYELVYQSRSGNPRMPWLEPDVCDAIKNNGGNHKAVLIIPIGFNSDNAEVLYDLDIEAKEAAQEAGLKYYRAKTVTDHPDFVAMFTKLIGEKLAGNELSVECCNVTSSD